jgi:NADP-dependent 3-hydroxy acid dehydrogenase YdfG
MENAMPALDGRISVVTGASSGIGRATAEALAREGSHVFIAGRDAGRLDAIARAIGQQGGQATVGAFDLHDSERLEDFVAGAAKTFGRLDVMVNAAGVDHPGTIADGHLTQWRDMFDTNVIALLVGSQAAIRAMRETKGQGHIVTISSYAGRGDGFRVYGATKAAANSISSALRKELEGDPIRAVTILPGAVTTNFGRHFPPEYVNGLFKSFGIPSDFETGDILSDETLNALHGRASAVFASPEDIARAVIYAVTQPHDLSVSEIVIGPRKSFPAHF